jgi:hypothetical protein
MKNLLSITDVSAMLQSWVKNCDEQFELVELPKVQDIRPLNPTERGKYQPAFKGDITLPWFAVFFDDGSVLVSDKVSALLRELRKIGYKVYDTSSLA